MSVQNLIAIHLAAVEIFPLRYVTGIAQINNAELKTGGTQDTSPSINTSAVQSKSLRYINREP